MYVTFSTLENWTKLKQSIMKLYRFILLFFFFSTSLSSIGQEIKGKIYNSESQSIAYATIYVEELQTGTSANQNGEYAIRVNPNTTVTITFRALGYSPTIKKIKVGQEDIHLDVLLGIQSYILTGVTVRADAEDPAYSVMRKAIARVPIFLNQAKNYTSEVYIKGAMKFEKIPRFIRNRMEMNGEKPNVNQVYVNESVNKITFTAPDSYKQEVISINNSFPMDEESVPVMGLISSSIYESSEDFFISPFATNSFAHYKFRHEGTLQDGALFINKIKVIPKRKSKLLIEGYLYIIEDLWCLYSYDVTIHPMFSKARIKQHFAPVKGNNYFPVNLFVAASFKAMGVKANGTYTTTIKYKNIELNPHLVNQKTPLKSTKNTYTKEKKQKQAKKPQEQEKINKEIEELLQNEDLSKREMFKLQKLMAKKTSLVVKEKDNSLEVKSNYQIVKNKNTLIKDSIYWDSIRPIPASSEEKRSYKKVAEKKAKKDSISKFKKTLSTLVFGNSKWSRKNFYLHYSGLLNFQNFDFHPVNGLEINQEFQFRARLDTMGNNFYIGGKLGYAIPRKTFFGEGSMQFLYKRMKRGVLIVKGEYATRDFNPFSGTDKKLNALYNLFFKQNYIKQYQSTKFILYNRIDIANGFTSSLKADWSKTTPLENITNYSFFFRSKDYAPNKPINQTIKENHLSNSKRLAVAVGFTYTPQQRYRIIGKTKWMLNSDYPTYGFNYRGAFALNDTYQKFHHFEFFVNQSIDIYTIAKFKYNLKAGFFIAKRHLHFSSFKHFKTMQEYFSITHFDDGFLLLNNYEYSTADKYAEAHFKYNNEFLLLKHLPLISNQIWKENLYLNLLLVEKQQAYYEFGYSISQILLSGEIGVFVGFKDTHFHQVGIKAMFAFD